ncbi:lysosomal cholesterol signaling protein isoform X1 [Hydra vulgaris]|uniref:lysosomal cholesterol signaling protein isoform X1 n=3 Tax=Hydra vulgaris TaxID=6087 RepID=UPI001F5E71E2|nr:integral membrane protein GPR155 isoform X1 [Hydra vulgaris]XP_047140756.1 integral membrane protein GPR155 isoform X1 [Hydra vulgaris]
MTSAVLSILPTLLGCFLLTLIGFLTGRFHMVTAEQGKGIRIFTGNFLLPGLIFKAMAQVNFSIVNWQLWTALLISKSIFFVIVILATLYFAKENKFGKAGLFAICVTQSNDFAFGIPLFRAIFPPTHQFLTDYMYLIAPVSLALLNPIGFIFLEYQQAKNNFESSVILSRSALFCKLFVITIKGIVTNPLIFTIVLGILVNFTFKRQIGVFSIFLDSLSNAFSATALFYLGWSLGINNKKTPGRLLLLPVLLAVSKGIFMPVMMRFVASNMVNNMLSGNKFGSNYTGNIVETFSFLYGTIPAAPTVMIFASKYQLAENIIGSTLVISTLFSGPIIFASVKMIEVINMSDIQMFLEIIIQVSTQISVIQIVCCVWVMIVFCCLQLFRHPLYRYTQILIFFQLLLGISVIILRYTHNRSRGFSQFIVWMLFTSLYSCCGSAVNMALNLYRVYLRKKTCWIFSIIVYFTIFSMTTMLVICTPSITIGIESSPSFLLSASFKNNDGILFIVIGLITLAVIVFAFVKINQNYVQESYQHHHDYYQPLEESYHHDCYQSIEENRTDARVSISDSIQTLMSNWFSSSSTDVKYVTNHVILLLGISFMIVINICVCLWNIVRPTQAKGIFLGVEMLAVVLTYGQAFFSLATFGFIKEFFMLSEIIRNYWIGPKVKKSPKLPNIDLLICHKFVKDHLSHCEEDLLETRQDGFSGKSFVDWLLEMQLVETRDDACVFANVLLQGHVIISFDGYEGLFSDDEVVYQFANSSLQTVIEN